MRIIEELEDALAHDVLCQHVSLTQLTDECHVGQGAAASILEAVLKPTHSCSCENSSLSHLSLRHTNTDPDRLTQSEVSLFCCY